MAECVHYWVIDSNNLGRCIRCGAIKQFPIDYPKLALEHRKMINALRTSYAPGSWLYGVTVAQDLSSRVLRV